MRESSEGRSKFGEFEVDSLRRVLLRNGEPVSITAKVFDTLLVLVNHHGQVVTKEELIGSVWPDKVVEEATLTQNIAVLRKILGESPSEHQYIVTVPGRGYSFVAPVHGTRAGAEPFEVKWKPRRSWQLALALAIGLAAGVSVTRWLPSPQSPPAQLVRFSFAPGHDVLDPEISPDGSHVAYVGGEGPKSLWVQDLDSEQPRELEATQGAQRPFWSPDSEFIGFSLGDELVKVSVRSGPPVPLCEKPSGSFAGGTWSPSGDSIIFSVALRRLYWTPAQGGPRESVPGTAEAGSPRRFWFPHFVPDTSAGRMLLLAERPTGQSQIVLRNLDTAVEAVLGPGSHPVYSPSGHVLYQTSHEASGLWALPVSLSEVRATGDAFPIAKHGRSPSVATDGTLVYLDSEGGAGWQLVVRNRAGERLATVGQPQQLISLPALSPDGRSVAVVGLENGNEDVWIHDLGQPVKARLTFGAVAEIRPVWSTEGDRILFSAFREGDWEILAKPADASSEAIPLASGGTHGLVTDWSLDGEYVLYRKDDPATGMDLWYFQRDGDRYRAAPMLVTPFEERAAKLSPDGRMVAYVSDESGRLEVYVRPFPDGSGKWQVSTEGGTQVRWSRNGKELFFVEGYTLVAAEVTMLPAFSVGTKRKLFSSEGLRMAPSHLPNYDVWDNGERFIVPERVAGDRSPVIRVVQNWFAEFRDR